MTSEWMAHGIGLDAAAGADSYRVTAAAPTLAKPGLSYIEHGALLAGRGYSISMDLELSDGARGAKRLTAYWLFSGFDTLPYGDGPYGGAVPFESRDYLPLPNVGERARYSASGVAPEGVLGIALQVIDLSTSTPWQADAWMEASAPLVELDPLAITVHPTMDPVPRVRLVLDDAPIEEVATVTVYALDEGRERPVRGAWRVTATSVMVFDDFAARLGVATTYRLEMHDANGALVRTSTQTAPVLDFQGTVVQHILDPYLATTARLIVGSEDGLLWKHDGSMVRPGSARYPTWIGSGRWPLQGIPLVLGTDTEGQEAAMRRIFALDSDEDHLPMIVLRTSHRVRFSQPLQAVVPEVSAQGLDWVAGGFVTHWSLTASEALPPAIGIVRAGTTWADVMALYPTWEALRAAYATWGAVMLDEGLAGVSNA